MRNKLFNPFVLDDELMPTPVPTGDVGGRTGQSSPDAYPCGLAEWWTKFSGDYNNDGSITDADYAAWWLSFGGNMGFNQEAWDSFNPGSPYPGTGGEDPGDPGGGGL